jgi:hypothetical protein
MDDEDLFYEAVRAITLLVAQAGGEITVTVSTMLNLKTTDVLQRFNNPDGSITYRVLDMSAEDT